MLPVIMVLFHIWALRPAHGHEVAWGDVPSWLTFGILLIGLPVGLVQLNMQRIQLRDQQHELQQSHLILERQQANKVDLTKEPSDVKPASFSKPGKVWMSVVTNGSDRPIRNVACRIRHIAGSHLISGARIGELVPMPAVQGGRSFQDLTPEPQAALMRIKQTCGFAFGVRVNDHPIAQVIVRFTDDVGLHWELDQDLHLKKLNNRDDW